MTSTENGAEPLLRLRGVSKNFGPVQALVDVDLEIRGRRGDRADRRQRRRQVGDRSRRIAGIHGPEHGQIFWEGKPVRIRTPREAAALGIETVYQDLALCNNLDIVQNMFLGRERLNGTRAPGRGVDGEGRQARRSPAYAVTTVRSIRQPVASLSGGQRQSVAIAKAVLWEAKLVIMDEPTAALGVAQTRMVLDLTRRLAEQGHAALFVSHNMNDVFEVADRIIVLYLGRVVAERPASELDRQIAVDLMTTGTSERLWPRTETPPDGEGRRDRPAARVGGRADRSKRLARPSSPSRPRSPRTPSGTTSEPRFARIKAGESGVLPVIAGLLLVSIFFESLDSKFLTAGNLVNLLVQAAVFSLLAMGEVFVLLLGEIDLSVGFVAGGSAG